MNALFPDLRHQARYRGAELIVDSFAGGGGASTGIEMAVGYAPDIAINHDPEAVAMHTVNHPTSRHFCQNVWQIDPVEVCGGRPVGLAWFSPDCKHFSKAKGGRPVEKRIRDLAWVVVHWAKRVRPRVIMLENVEEFQTWCPLDADGQPDFTRKGETFTKWVGELQKMGYRVEWRELRACDYGAPTIRKRLFLIARCDGAPIVWPAPTHGKPGTGLLPYRTAAEIIDWSIPCPSIFDRKRPLAEATMNRIAAGLRRFVLDASQPFIVTCNHSGHGFRGQGLDEPFKTITSAHDAHGLVVPYLAGCGGRAGQSAPRSADAPMATMTAKADQILCTDHLTKFQENSTGQEADEPLHTVMAGAQRFGVVAAWMAQHNTGVVGRDLADPISTIMHTGSHQQLVTSHLIKLRGTCKDGQPVTEPAPTITAGGTHVGEVRAFLIKYFGSAEHGQPVDEPLHTVTAKPRFGLVTVDGTDWQIVDIGMRMLSPRDLFRVQGFPDDYIIDFEVEGRTLPKSSQVRMCGNSVCPPMSAALVRANFNRALACQGAAE